MIHLVNSNRLDALADALAERLATQRATEGIFEPIHLIVPSRHLETYAKVHIANRCGIAFHLITYQLDRLLHDLLAAHSHGKLRFLDLPALRGMLLTALLDGGLGNDALAPVSNYIHQQVNQDAAELRKFQLATELAVVFQEYTFAFPTLFDAWRQDLFALDGIDAQEELWQRTLWRQVFGPHGVIEQQLQHADISWLSLEDLTSPESPFSLDRFPLPRSFHVFGVSHGGQILGRILGTLARRSEVHVYALNPCAEFWEDVPSLHRHSQKGSKPTFVEESDPPLLRLWGRPGRDGARLLNTLAQYQFEERFLNPPGDSLLHVVQRDILFRQPERQEPDGSLHADRSICVLACPGVRREIETVASEIIELLRKDSTLCFHEIGIVVGTREVTKYLPQITSIFSETGEIPYNILDLPIATENRVIEVLELLFSIPFGSFVRQDLLRLCTHPLVAARFPDDDPEDWVRWCDSVGIVHGADHSDHRETYILRDLFNWEQGARRLALGAFLTGERSGDSRSFTIQDEEYLPEEHSQAGQLEAGRFGLLIRSLISDAHFMRGQSRPFHEWLRFLCLLATSYITTSSDGEKKELTRCITALQATEDGSIGESPIPYRLAYQLVLSTLADLKATRGQLTSSGVVIGPLQKLRGLPFRVLFFVGLNEGRFPEMERRSALDLRQTRQLGTEGTTSRERDKYAFLEVLLATKDAFYMSYAHRDLLTQEPLQPSSVVSDLIEVLRRGYLGEQEAERLTEVHHLRRFDSSYFPEIYQLSQQSKPIVCRQPEAQHEARSVELRRLLGNQNKINLDEIQSLEQKVPFAWPKIRDHLRLFELPEAPKLQEEVDLRVNHLRYFLECPLQGYARYVLNLSEEEEDLVRVEDEPFSTMNLRKVALLRSWIAEALVRGVDPTSVLKQRTPPLEQRGKAPTGIFSEVELQEFRDCLKSWDTTAQELLGHGRKAEIICFGARDEHDYEVQMEAPLLLEVPLSGRIVQVRLTGTTNPLLRTRRGSMIFDTKGRHRSSEQQEKRFLRCFFDHLLLAASGRPPAPHSALLVYAENSFSEITFSAIEPEKARIYLANLVADMLSGPHAYLLPCEAVFFYQKGLEKDQQKYPSQTLKEHIEKLQNNPRVYLCPGPVSQLDSFRIPDEEEAQAWVQRRFSLFFSRVTPAIPTSE